MDSNNSEIKEKKYKQHFYKLLGHIMFRIFSSQCHNSLVFAGRQIANNLSRIAKKL